MGNCVAGQIQKIDPVEREVVVTFDQREVVYDYGELDEVALAYAITIHKSQGSEFPAVVNGRHKPRRSSVPIPSARANSATLGGPSWRLPFVTLLCGYSPKPIATLSSWRHAN